MKDSDLQPWGTAPPWITAYTGPNTITIWERVKHEADGPCTNMWDPRKEMVHTSNDGLWSSPLLNPGMKNL